ncbi:C-terminal binding protein [Halomicrobium urmianum]|uniref:C-terminal binding protein n=1 Tax=Halomicrobium urmianum TaxID=1586233 RepID=UPI001CD93DC6|nr:C-terminal binding protein [Halomicrobium urmianum]
MDVVAVDDPMIDADRIEAALGEEDAVRTTDADDGDALAAAADGADALVVDVNTPVTAPVLAASDALRIVARAGVGVDNVDVEAAAERGVHVTNVPEYCQDEVATHAVTLLLACLRRVTGLDRDVRAGEWDWAGAGPVRRLAGTTVGLASYGPIARRVADRLAGFGVDLVAYDPYVDADEMADDGVEKASLGDLLDRADHLVVLAPLTEETRGLIDGDALDRLPDHAVVVNAGRGGVVDEGALDAALREDGIAAAGLDVFENEPPTDSPLLDRDDVVCTPHAGWFSVEARAELNDAVARNLRAVRDGETPPDRIEPETDWV